MSDSHPGNPGEKNSEPKKSAISRRKFLSYAGLLGVAPLVGQLKTVQRKIIPQAKLPVVLPAGLTFNVLRPDDLLCLDFEFINMKLTGLAGSQYLVKENRSRPAYMIVHFPPQSVVEEAFYERTPELNDLLTMEPLKPPPVFSRISGPSRLSFIIPDEIDKVPLTLESLLAWQLYQPSLVPVALPPAISGPAPSRPGLARTGTSTTNYRSLVTSIGPSGQNLYLQQNRLAQAQIKQINRSLLKPGPPEKYQTAIEMPYRLILSPNIYNVWVHTANPLSMNGWTELWHTRLAALNQDGSVSETDNPNLAVRAVWSPDVDLDKLIGPYPENLSKPRLSLSPNHRHQIVHLTSNFTLKNPNRTSYEPQPVWINNMMLSPLGAWLDSIGNWPANSPMLGAGAAPVITWQHMAAMGRDYYVKVATAGYLLPFGHRASLVTVTERKFFKTQEGQNIAYLFQKKYIMVRDPERVFPAPYQPVKGGMKIPFTRVKLTTLVTPPIAPPSTSPLISGAGELAFWPMVSNQDFIFQALGTDVEGHEVQFKMPMAYIAGSYAFENVGQSVDAYKLASRQRRQPDFLGQTISFAQENKAGDTSFEVESISWLLEVVEQNQLAAFQTQDQPMCFPVMESASINIPALKNLVGFDNTLVKYADVYINQAFKASQNRGEVFFQILNPPLLDFAAGGKAEKSGGIATPSFSIVGLSRILGPVGANLSSTSSEPQPEAGSGPLAEPDEEAITDALQDAISGKFDPKKFFTDKAKILGGILLQDVIDQVNDFTSPANSDRALNIKTEQLYEDDGKTPVGVKTLLKWTPGVRDVLFFVANRGSTKSTLTLDVEAAAYYDGREATYKVKGELTDFTLDLIKGITTFVLLKFSKFTFTTEKGKKTDVDPKIASIEFKGPLKFIKELLDKIPLPGGSSDADGGFGGKPIVKVDAAGAKLGYALTIPDVSFGVFTMQNLKFSGEIYLPFNGDPVSIRFAFNEKNNPFLLTVCMFGGGGFFAIELQPHGIKLVEASLEFGGSFSMNLGVASGGVTLMAGIYFKYEDDNITISGYVRCTGELDVLGLISIFAEFYLSLTYEEAGNKVWGQASLTVKIKIVFFSIKVTLKVEREFGHSPAPLFCDLMEETDWQSYCQAFA
ncbi:MAG: hypothetical protein PHU81_05045 [Acidobacteriota bacterium]|nr:hypothetical protein [Acidobacteriota bacterium]